MAEEQAGESLLEPTDLETDVYSIIRSLFRKAWKRGRSLGLVPLKLSNLYRGSYSTELPLPNARRSDAGWRLAVHIDTLRKTHGDGIILRGHDFRLRQPPADALAKPAAAPGGGH